jgi:hypothetical protein
VWRETVLGFAKLDAPEGWRLAVREIAYASKDDEEPTADYDPPSPLWRASRELRISALDKMPALVKRLGNEVKKALDAITKAKKLVAE